MSLAPLHGLLAALQVEDHRRLGHGRAMAAITTPKGAAVIPQHLVRSVWLGLGELVGDTK